MGRGKEPKKAIGPLRQHPAWQHKPPESQSKPGIKMLYPELCKDLRRRPQLFMAGSLPSEPPSTQVLIVAQLCAVGEPAASRSRSSVGGGCRITSCRPGRVAHTRVVRRVARYPVILGTKTGYHYRINLKGNEKKAINLVDTINLVEGILFWRIPKLTPF